MNVLIIDFYHSSDNVGGLRWKRFAKYLPGEGINPIILTVGEKSDDDDNIFHCPFPFDISARDGFAKGKDDSLWGRIKRAIRGNIFFPDPRRLWFCYGLASDLILRCRIDMCITTGPPHSVHLIGKRLKKNFGIKWIADFRDPWLPYYYKDLYLTKVAKLIQETYELIVLKNADAILAVEPGIVAEDYIISNGFDPDDFQGTVEPGSEFIYVGSLQDRKLLPPINFKHVYGKSHSEAVQEMRKAGYLLICYIDDVIPSKVYEYMASGRPILSFGIRGKCAELIEACRAGLHFDDIKRTKNQLRLVTFSKPLQSYQYKEEIEKFNVKNITKELARVIFYERM